MIRGILLLLIICCASLLLGIGYYWLADTAPARGFTTREVLISLDDMPQGWKVVYGPGKAEDAISGKDSATIRFTAIPEFQVGGAAHSVYRYGSSRKASNIYQELVLPGEVGSKPTSWSFVSSIADQSHFACYDYEGRQPPICSWSARYEEYIVIFHAWLIPERMSLGDIEKVIRVIDDKMRRYLGK